MKVILPVGVIQGIWAAAVCVYCIVLAFRRSPKTLAICILASSSCINLYKIDTFNKFS